MKNITKTLLALTLIGTALPSAASTPPAELWGIGPIIRGRNYSQGMPLQPTPLRQGWFFDFPYPSAEAGHVHYVTFNPGSLLGKSRITVRYQVDAGRGTRFVPQESPGVPATVSLYFQRRGDTWSAKGRYENYRWYAPAHSVRQIRPGVQELTVSLNDPAWGSIHSQTAAGSPGAFREALADTSSLGLVFGTVGYRGHGVYSTGPARFTLISFDIY
ncbi:MAG: hypothetical protein H0W74_04810 [Sphingosinicella sp.]|nr:hypothetical protein [Sphingosinicella sp.]